MGYWSGVRASLRPDGFIDTDERLDDNSQETTWARSAEQRGPIYNGDSSDAWLYHTPSPIIDGRRACGGQLRVSHATRALFAAVLACTVAAGFAAIGACVPHPQVRTPALCGACLCVVAACACAARVRYYWRLHAEARVRCWRKLREEISRYTQRAAPGPGAAQLLQWLDARLPPAGV